MPGVVGSDEGGLAAGSAGSFTIGSPLVLNILIRSASPFAGSTGAVGPVIGAGVEGLLAPAGSDEVAGTRRLAVNCASIVFAIDC